MLVLSGVEDARIDAHVILFRVETTSHLQQPSSSLDQARSGGHFIGSSASKITERIGEICQFTIRVCREDTARHDFDRFEILLVPFFIPLGQSKAFSLKTR